MADHPWFRSYDPGVPRTLGEYPDRTLLDYVDAALVVRMGQAVSSSELRDWCKARLAPYKVPARVVFKRELPKSMIGKVLRRLLTEEGGAAS